MHYVGHYRSIMTMLARDLTTPPGSFLLANVWQVSGFAYQSPICTTRGLSNTPHCGSAGAKR
jgi:hypothetical protein